MKSRKKLRLVFIYPHLGCLSCVIYSIVLMYSCNLPSFVTPVASISVEKIEVYVRECYH